MREKVNGNTKSSLFDQLLECLKQDDTRFRGSSTVQSREMVINGYDRAVNPPRTSRDYQLFALEHLCKRIGKKFVGSTRTSRNTDASRKKRAFLTFVSRNAECYAYNLNYLAGFPQRGWGDKFADDVLFEVRGELSTLVDSGDRFTLSRIAKNLQVGPGSSSGLKSDPGFYSRLCSSRITFSSSLVQQLYRTCTLTSPLTRAAELKRRSQFEDIVGIQAVAVAVPKTNETSRFIATQPSGNMACELSIHAEISHILKTDYDIDLEVQQFLNRDLAQMGSMQCSRGEKRSWNFCTEDLTNASDYPVASLHQVLQPETRLAQLIGVLRCTHISLGRGYGVIQKHMVSTMGNGMTFSLMTLILSTIVKVLYVRAGLPLYDTFNGVKKKTFAVYGDDIIVDKSVVASLRLCLDRLGFEVNKAKSYNTGFFRESCGGDYYFGRNVRPVFIENLETGPELASAFNRLADWSISHSIPLPSTLKFLEREARRRGMRACPNYEDTSAGLHLPFHLRKQDGNEILKLVKPMKIDDTNLESSTVVNMCRDYQLKNWQSHVYIATVAVPSHRIVMEERYRMVPYTDLSDLIVKKQKQFVGYRVKRNFNQYGYIMGLLDGSCRDRKYGIRPKIGETVQQLKIAPNWCDFRLLVPWSLIGYGTNVQRFTSQYLTNILK